mmetsp:Transcript_23407/g.61746  ORF Transcript_23407/g.61746 Transcript_23407/m.61746 type:complete len:120 (+) Transcript_23407:2-361(+)
MQRLFMDADLDGNGSVDLGEWLSICNDSWVQVWLRAQDIMSKDASLLFELLDDGDGKLTADELIHGMASLKGVSAVMQVLATMSGVSKRVNEIRADMLFTQLPVAAERSICGAESGRGG